MSVYTSEQYQILLDLSGLLTAAMTDGCFERAVSASLSTKLDRDHEFIFFTSEKNKHYSTSISGAGIQIVNTSDTYTCPALKLKYLNTEYYTFDKLYDAFSSQNIENPSAYASHYTSGSLPTLTFDLTTDIPSISILASVLDRHNNYEESHKNLNSLLYYYNKTAIDIKENDLNNRIRQLEQNLTTKIITDDNDVLAKLNNHINTLDCHQNINKLKNYYLKSEHNIDIANLKQDLKNHNKNNNAHQDIRQLITYNTSLINNFKTQYRYQHTDAKQIEIHNMLISKTEPYTDSNYLIINNNYKDYNAAYFTIRNKNNNVQDISLKISQDKNQNTYFDNNSYNGTGQFIFRQYNASGNNTASVVLLNNQGKSIFNDIETNNIKINNYTYPGNTDNTYASSKKWVIDYVEQYIKSIFQYSPYDSMADYAHTLTLENAAYDNIYKINVPGYIYFYTGHCPDCDMVIYGSYDSSCLENLNQKNNVQNVVKLFECYGNGDRDQSAIYLPVFPGTKTYLLLSNDYSATNIKNCYWIFIPTLGVRNITTNSSKYVTLISTTKRPSDSLKRHRNINTTPSLSVYQRMFNTLTNADIWKTNFIDWS